MTARLRDVGVEEDAPSVLAMVLDLTPSSWASHPDRLQSHLNAILLFANAFCALSQFNKLLLYAVHPSAVERVWPVDASLAAEHAPPELLQRALFSAATRLLQTAPPADGSSVKVAAALALAVCRLHRARRLEPHAHPRMLVAQASPDDPGQHLAIIDAAFAAQKLEICADVVVLPPMHHSLPMQQLSQLTNGLYLHVDDQTSEGLSYLLISALLPDQHVRRTLASPAQKELDTRGLCAITRKPVDIGYACSVCLTVVNTNSVIACPMCGTRFALPKLAGKAAARKKPKVQGARTGPPASSS